MAADARFGGHFVLGHVDLVGEVVSSAPQLRVRIGSEHMRLLVEKGSISVDGVSLTVFDLDAESFEVAVIPHTAAATTLGVRRPGDKVNIELDVLAKHVQRLVSKLDAGSRDAIGRDVAGRDVTTRDIAGEVGAVAGRVVGGIADGLGRLVRGWRR